MKKKQQEKFSQSLVDFLMNIPGFENKLTKNPINTGTVSKLFKIWKNSKNQISSRVFTKPDVISRTELDEMQKEGLVNVIGDKIQITSKGSEIIKILILGDERSVFEDNGKDIDIHTAQSNIAKIAKKREEKNWWKRYLSLEH